MSNADVSDLHGHAIACAQLTASKQCDFANVSFDGKPLSDPRSCLPWPASWTSVGDLDPQIDSRDLKVGVIGRLRCEPAAAMSSLCEVEAERRIHALYVLSGEMTLEQIGHTSTVRSRGIIVFDTSCPARLRLPPALRHDIISLTIPRRSFAAKGAEDALLGGVLVRGSSASPLSSCLRLIAEHFPSASTDELTILFDACTSLLALAARQCTEQAVHGDADGENHLLRAIRDYADKNVADTTLRPAEVSQRFGISTRYLHKLFRASGTTFCKYVLNRRLEQIQRELAAMPFRPQPIAALALKWGFKDVSTFNKAFRKRFGCAPRRFRARGKC